MVLTKSQKELLNLLKNDSTYYISYDNVMARAALRKEDERIKTIKFDTFLAIRKFLQEKKEQHYNTIRYFEINPNIKLEQFVEINK